MRKSRRKRTKKTSKKMPSGSHRELVATVDSREARIGLVEDGKLVELFIERSTERLLVGNIYKGTVKTVIPGIEAAFIDVGQHKNGFLHASDITDAYDEYDEVVEDGEGGEEGFRPHSRRRRKARVEDMLKPGQELMVQVAKEPMGQKGMRLTNYVSLPGRYIVLMPTFTHLGGPR